MIPRDYITEWRAHAPWADNTQVEQDLAICRALVNIFSHPVLRNALAFRGGTALYKLYLTPAARYSEDIDFVQVRAEPAGAVMDALHEVLDPWLGKPQWKQTEGRVTFNYRFSSEDPTPLQLSSQGRSEHPRTFHHTRLPARDRSRSRPVGSMGPPTSPPTIWTSSSAPSFAHSTSGAKAATCTTWHRTFRGRCRSGAHRRRLPALYERGRARRHAGGVRGQPRGENGRQAFSVGHPSVARRRPELGCAPSRRARRGAAFPASP